MRATNSGEMTDCVLRSLRIRENVPFIRLTISFSCLLELLIWTIAFSPTTAVKTTKPLPARPPADRVDIGADYAVLFRDLNRFHPADVRPSATEPPVLVVARSRVLSRCEIVEPFFRAGEVARCGSLSNCCAMTSEVHCTHQMTSVSRRRSKSTSALPVIMISSSSVLIATLPEHDVQVLRRDRKRLKDYPNHRHERLEPQTKPVTTMLEQFPIERIVAIEIGASHILLHCMDDLKPCGEKASPRKASYGGVFEDVGCVNEENNKNETLRQNVRCAAFRSVSKLSFHTDIVLSASELY